MVKLPSDKATVLDALRRFVREAGSSAVFRLQLERHPSRTLATYGFAVHETPAELRVSPSFVPPRLEHDLMFVPDLPRRARRREAVPVALGLVAFGIKPMVLMHGPRSDLIAQGQWARQRGLEVMLSPFELVPVADQGKGGFANIGDMRLAQGSSNNWCGLLIGAEWNQVSLGWLSLLFGWDELLGTLLGYPTCCAQAYVERWPTAVRKHQGDLVPMVLDTQSTSAYVGSFDWYSNVLARYFGYELIQHFPCRLDCQATRRLARRYEQVLERFEPQVAKCLKVQLAVTVLYTEHEGIYLLRNARIREENGEVVVTYEPKEVLASAEDSTVARLVRTSNMIRSTNGDATLTIGGRVAEGRMVSFVPEIPMKRD